MDFVDRRRIIAKRIHSLREARDEVAHECTQLVEQHESMRKVQRKAERYRRLSNLIEEATEHYYSL